MNARLRFSLVIVALTALLSCKNGVNLEEEFVNVDGILDSIHGEIRTVGGGSYPIIFKFTYDALQRPAKISYTSFYFDYLHYEITLTYPNDAEVHVKYQNHDGDAYGSITIYHTDYKIDSAHRLDRGYNSPYPNIHSTFHHQNDEIVQIDSITYTRERDSTSYLFSSDTIVWELNKEGYVIGRSGQPFVYDDKPNVMEGSFFQVFWGNHMPYINVRTFMPIIPGHNIIPVNAEFEYKEGLLVKIKVLEIPQYELYYSY